MSFSGLPDKETKLKNGIILRCYKELTEDKGGEVEAFIAVDEKNGRELVRVVKKDDKIISTEATEDAQESGLFETVAKKAGVKKEDMIYPKATKSADEAAKEEAKSRKDAVGASANRESESVKLLKSEDEQDTVKIEGLSLGDEKDQSRKSTAKLFGLIKKIKNSPRQEHKKPQFSAEEKAKIQGRPVLKKTKSDLSKDDKPHPPGSPKDSAHDVAEGARLEDEIKQHSGEGVKKMLKHLRAKKQSKEWSRSLKKREKLQKDVVDFKTRKKIGEAGQKKKPKSRSDKIKAALEAQSKTNPYAEPSSAAASVLKERSGEVKGVQNKSSDSRREKIKAVLDKIKGKADVKKLSDYSKDKNLDKAISYEVSSLSAFKTIKENLVKNSSLEKSPKDKFDVKGFVSTLHDSQVDDMLSAVLEQNVYRKIDRNRESPPKWATGDQTLAASKLPGLLSKGESNPKTVKKAKELGVETAILHLAPADLSGCGTSCPAASMGCRQSCLNTSGRGGMIKQETGQSDVVDARIRKTRFLAKDPELFLHKLNTEIEALKKRAAKNGTKPAIRLNGTSDLPWERFKPDSFGGKNLFEMHPDVQFYDYTKRPDRVLGNKHDNYSLTFSKSEVNGNMAKRLLDKGHNVAWVFGGKALPGDHEGYPVLPGDEHDLRFLDPKGHKEGKKGHIVGLVAKGDAKMDRSGFVTWGHAGDPDSKPRDSKESRYDRIRRQKGLKKTLKKTDKKKPSADETGGQHVVDLGIKPTSSNSNYNKFKEMASKSKGKVEKSGKDRCWDGYEPAPGKKPYSKGSCQPVKKALKKGEKDKKPFKGYNKEKHSEEGGLNDKARKKYNRENNANLKRPVTEKNPKGGAKKRKKSFCARMSGTKGPTSKDGELTPKGAALKRWNCNKSQLKKTFDLVKAWKPYMVD